jgi:hypothetical protein
VRELHERIGTAWKWTRRNLDLTHFGGTFGQVIRRARVDRPPHDPARHQRHRPRLVRPGCSLMSVTSTTSHASSIPVTRSQVRGPVALRPSQNRSSRALFRPPLGRLLSSRRAPAPDHHEGDNTSDYHDGGRDR